MSALAPRLGAPALPVAEVGACAVHRDRNAAATCTRCGSFACEECLFVSTQGLETCRACAYGGLDEPVPLERRRSLGWWKATRATIRLAMLQPSRFFRTPPAERGFGVPLLFATGLYTFGQICQVAWVMLGMGALWWVAASASEAAIRSDQAALVSGLFVGYSLAAVLCTLVQAPVYGLLGAVLAGALTHGTLRLLGRARAPLERTLRAVCYANAPLVLGVVPLLGGLVGWFWMLGLEVIGVRETHRTSTGTALIAVMGYRLVFCLGVVGLYGVLVALAFAAKSAGP